MKRTFSLESPFFVPKVPLQKHPISPLLHPVNALCLMFPLLFTVLCKNSNCWRFWVSLWLHNEMYYDMRETWREQKLRPTRSIFWSHCISLIFNWCEVSPLSSMPQSQLGHLSPTQDAVWSQWRSSSHNYTNKLISLSLNNVRKVQKNVLVSSPYRENNIIRSKGITAK